MNRSRSREGAISGEGEGPELIAGLRAPSIGRAILLDQLIRIHYVSRRLTVPVRVDLLTCLFVVEPSRTKLEDCPSRDGSEMEAMPKTKEAPRRPRRIPLLIVSRSLKSLPSSTVLS